MILSKKERIKLNKLIKELGYEEKINKKWQLISIIEDLADEINNLKEELEKTKADIWNNYKPIDRWEEE